MSSMTVKSYNPKTNSGQPYNHNSLRYPLHNIPSAISHSENRPFQGRDVEELANQHNLCRHSASKSKDSEDDSARKSPVNRIASNFRIPESVNSSGGSLAEFAAEITCLFWFESAATLRQAEGFTGGSCIDRGLLPDATPTIGFRKWVTTILTTTLISRNVILLALLFIYRLKQFNPDVSGKRGSEFRLLTIALMLGNKFLDDNTYTNKTWAEVSGISVTEIHIMEVEFLSNMRYNLYVSEAEWGRWKVKLGSFGSFFRTASNVPSMDASPAPVTPMLQGFPHKLPSPPSTHHSSLSYSIARPGAANYPALPKHYSTALVPPQSPIRPDQTTLSDFPGRKRGLDSFSELPPAKRLFPESSLTPYSTTSTPGTMGTTPASVSVYTPESSVSGFSLVDSGQPHDERVPRLPMPRIRTTTNQSGDFNGSQLAPISLPNGRAMSTVYPSSSNTWPQQTTPVSTTPISNVNLYSNPIPNLGSSSRSHSAFPSANTSPNVPSYHTANPSRPGQSPSYFLTNRSSPYRPVRNVNTLLIPPPSASLHNPSRNITHDQIHYQPLSKTTTDRRTGVVPYLQSDAWLQSYTPSVPPQPEFGG